MLEFVYCAIANQKGIAMLRIVLICFSVFLTSCSLMPLSGSNSGRSIGEGNIETHFSLIPVQAAQMAYGVTKDLDVGGLIEYGFLSLSLEAWIKYALINEEKGHGLSLVAGAFSTASLINSRGNYAGGIYSYRTEGFEPYVKLKINNVSWDDKAYKNKDADKSNFSNLIMAAVESADRYYLRYGFGSRIYISDKSAIGLGFVGIKSKNVESKLLPEFNFTINF